jgi:hypothetical protein
MSIPVIRRGPAVLAVAAALLLAVLVSAQAASASPLFACVKKNGSARLFGKKPKCKKGEKLLSWNTDGLPGRNGANGLNGSNGVNGTNGKEGKEGPAGPYVDALPNGKSEKGVWAVIGNGKSGGFVGDRISFTIPLSSSPTVHFIPPETTPPAGCAGSVSAPAAAPGNLCVFNIFAPLGAAFTEFYNPETGTNKATTAGKTGVLLIFSSTVEGSQAAAGTWAVTE